MNGDAAFAGSIPALYDRCLGPLLFEPYARDLAERVRALAPGRILETAAGTGIVTAALADALPGAEIVATDLNQDMLTIASARPQVVGVRLRVADAQALPFADRTFDAVVCQFGAMFFPDRPLAYREARRVLRADGALMMNVWDRLDRNPVSQAVAQAMARSFPGDPPCFLQRGPHGYHDPTLIEGELRAAGFRQVDVEQVVLSSRVSASQAAAGLVRGSPLAAEVRARGAISAATAAATEALGPFDGRDMPMSAWVITARS